MNKLIRQFSGNQRLAVTVFSNLTAIAGIVLFVSFMNLPSEVESQFLFGLSRIRFSVGVVFLVLLLANLGVAVLSISRLPWWQEYLDSKLMKLVASENCWICIVPYFLAITTGALLLLMIPPVPVSFRYFEPIIQRISGLTAWLFMVGCLSIILIRIFDAEYMERNRMFSILDQVLIATCVLLATFFLYEHFAAWIGWVNKTKYSYWNLLAGEFLNGRLYLVDPPHTHDLTQYQGRWYVPNPPMPAIVMIPLAFLIGSTNIITSDFSMFFSAVNSMLVFLILDQLAKRRWILLSRNGILCLVVLFAFGTPHLWVGISGRMWFVSQILTVTFLALAVFSVLKSWSPWSVGTFIGVAVATRPNGLMTWVFVFAIAMEILKETNREVNFRQMLNWSVKSVIPVAISVVGLLLYNHARFNNYLDFGYITISGDPGIVQNARTYGLFSPHYISYNLRVMFLYLPEINWGPRWPFLPSGAGMSLFLTTPALLYLIHRYEFKWWILGAWLSVLFNFILLVLYHNTGRDQFGYRYILDALVPLIALLGVVLGKKISWLFLILLVLSILINLYGANWVMNG